MYALLAEDITTKKGALLMSIQPGQRLGNYTVLRPVGQGGFADVYLGQHIYLNTYAAIKVLQSRMTESDFTGFKTEAQTIANLTHPHIVRVLEFGKEADLPFLVMDYCPDGTLRKRHPKGTRISLVECIGYVKQMATALQYAHNAKVIHRDIKPENMLVGKDGTILLSDFGIAVAAQSSRYQSGQNVGGTLVYMAPEQFDGRATFASDQYALGVVVYEWLSGETPFKGSPMEIIAQQFKGQIPPLRAKIANLPAAVELVVQKALKREPQQRFQSVQVFADALEQASQGKMPAALSASYDTGSISATQKAQPGQTDIPTYRNEPGQGTTISPGAPGGTMPASPAGQRPNSSTGSSTYNPTISTQSSYTPPAYTPPAYTAPPPGAMMSPPYGQPYLVQPQKKSKTGCYIAVIVVLVLALCGVGSLAMTNFASRSDPSGGTTLTSGSSDNGTSTQTTNAPKNAASATDGTFPKNIKLTCGGCNDPIIVTIKSITVDSGKGRTAWELSLYNNTLSTFPSTEYSFQEFGLQEAAATDVVGSSDCQNTADIPSNQSITLTCIFSFVPFKNERYTLSMKLYAYGADTITFDPAYVTFS
jgi:serine/threonine protein kinase